MNRVVAALQRHLYITEDLDLIDLSRTKITKNKKKHGSFSNLQHS